MSVNSFITTLKKQHFLPLGLSVCLGLITLGNHTANSQTTQPTWHNCLTREVWSPQKQAWCSRLKSVRNAQYSIPDFGVVPLTNGTYQSTNPSFSVTLVNRQGLIDFADINGDYIDDAAVLLSVNSGSKQLLYLAAVIFVNGKPTILPPVLLGDRVDVKSVSISQSQIVVDRVTLQYFIIGDGGKLVENLPARSPSSSAIVKGTVSYRERIALPPTAIVEIKLQDVSLQDKPAATLATQRIMLDGKQVPVSFELSYDPQKIDPKRTYAVQASILVDGKLRFINTSSYQVITQGNPTSINIVVQPAS